MYIDEREAVSLFFNITTSESSASTIDASTAVWLAKASSLFPRTSDCRTAGDFGLAQITARRVQVVDVEQQIVMMSVVFLRTPGNERWRNHFTHTISIEDGLIRHVDEYLDSAALAAVLS